MKFLSVPIACLGLMLATAALADDHPVVVELYTSQGCSSCPPADKILHELAGRRDVIALSLHVDYWDYIGWKDQFARPEHTARQKAYARVGGRTMIYTPQMIVNGQDAIAGARAMQLAERIEAHHDKAVRAILTTRVAGGRVTATARPAAGAQLSGPFVVQLVRYAPRRSVTITRGELAGQNLDYANVVESWDRIGEWDGQGEADWSAPLTGDLPAAILVQQGTAGPILAAARVTAP